MVEEHLNLFDEHQNGANADASGAGDNNQHKPKMASEYGAKFLPHAVAEKTKIAHPHDDENPHQFAWQLVDGDKKPEPPKSKFHIPFEGTSEYGGHFNWPMVTEVNYYYYMHFVIFFLHYF